METRHIILPTWMWDGPVVGQHVACAVVVDWPELQLTPAQGEANAIARACGAREPYPNLAIFTVHVPRPM